MTAEIIQFGEQQRFCGTAVAQQQRHKERMRKPPDFEATLAEASKSGDVFYLAGIFDALMSAVEILHNSQNQPRIYEVENEMPKGVIELEIERLNGMLKAIAGELEGTPSVRDELERNERVEVLARWAFYWDVEVDAAMVALAKAAATPIAKNSA